MNPIQFLAASSGLGVGGFDPAPALIAAVFMAARPSETPEQARGVRRDVLLFGTVLIVGTVLWGVGLSLLVGERLANVPWYGLLRAGGWAAGVELLLAIAGFCAAGYKWVHRNDPPREEKARNRAGLMLVALGFVAIVTADVPFIVTIGLSSHQPVWAMIPAFIVWAVVSQFPLFVLCIAVLVNKHRKVSRVIGRAWDSLRTWVRWAVPVGLASVSVLLLLDAARFFLLGRFLIG